MFEVNPIAFIWSTRKESVDDHWDEEEAWIELAEPFTAEAIQGLENFSHVEVVMLFDGIEPGSEHTGLRHPRNNPEWPSVGIFAQRGARRPNRIGVTRCRLLAVEGRSLRVEGLDGIDGTPVLDIKPVMREFEARGEIVQPTWATELMRDYWNRRV